MAKGKAQANGAAPAAPAVAEKQKEKATASTEKKAQSPPQASKSSASESAGGVLSSIRPKPRCIFFFLFALLCIGIVLLHDQCTVKGKKRDCGYSGITPASCRAFGCFTKGGKAYDKKTIKVNVESGSSLGFTIEREGSKMQIARIEDGAVNAHNSAAQAGSGDLVLVGDEIKKISAQGRSWSNPADVEKALKKKDLPSSVEIEVVRSRLPAQLQWLHSKDGKGNNWAERILTAPGTEHFLKIWSRVFAIGASTWFISGYSRASLPMYTLLSGAVSWELSRCCHDSNVGGGVAHCYRNRRDPLSTILQEAYSSVAEKVKEVAENPRQYAKWLFQPTLVSL
mmetsp:Transcript_25317/g.53794  ORF Transcript_25317/g.53794 Transcript_25317/m.53794 type:complete len:340 (-) Transcript_25317:85-1104(-)